MGIMFATDKNEVDLTPKKISRKIPKGSVQFRGAIEGAKQERASEITKLYENYINAFKDVEDGGLGKTVHMEYLADRGNLVIALEKRLKDEGFKVDLFTNRGRKIVAVDLSLQ